jgi:hypothetical protein
MSAPDVELKKAENIALRFMANGTYTALDALREGKPIAEYQSEALKDAAGFLERASSAADFISADKWRKEFNPYSDLGTLRCALGPMDSLKNLMTNNDISEFFGKLTQTVEAARDRKLDAMAPERLEQAAEFFRVFHQWLVTERNRQKPVLGTSILSDRRTKLAPSFR